MLGLQVNITPEVVKWARETCNFTLEEAAKKIGRDPDEIAAWESGDVKPSIAQARKASEVYKRPLAVFFLPHVPKDFSTLRDFRKLPDDFPREYVPNLVFLIRQTQEHQEWVRDYLQSEGFSSLDFIGNASIQNNPATVALKIRSILKVHQTEVFKCKTRDDALKLWVEAAENIGIFVLQSGNMQYEKIAVEEARGFALSDKYAPFVFLNAQDAKSARIFTLAHELVHLWINEPGVSNMALKGRTLKGVDEIETYCNSVAAEVILPQSEFSTYWKTLDHNDDIINRIDKTSNRFKVSKDVITRRLLNLRAITQKQYFEYIEMFYQEWLEYKKQEERKKQDTETWANPYLSKVINNGRTFFRIVLGAYQGGKLSGRDMSNLLGIKIDKISKYAEKAGMKFPQRRAFQ